MINKIKFYDIVSNHKIVHSNNCKIIDDIIINNIVNNMGVIEFSDLATYNTKDLYYYLGLKLD
jgi:hypothetical protein